MKNEWKRKEEKEYRRKLFDKLKLTKVAIEITKLDTLKANPEVSLEEKEKLVKKQICLIKYILKQVNTRKTIYIPLMICEGLLVTAGLSQGILSVCEQEYLRTLFYCVASGCNFYLFKDVLMKEVSGLNSANKLFKKALEIANSDLNLINNMQQ